MNITSITPSATALRALSHPTRLRILGLLRSEGQATSTTLAQRLGLNTGATSFHLRSLHQHGFIEEDTERGNARDRWWRAVHHSVRTGQESRTTPEGREAVDALVQSVAVVHTEALQRHVEEAPALTDAWQEASTIAGWNRKLTAARAKELMDAVLELVSEWDEDETDGEHFVVQLHGFPQPGQEGVS